MHYDRLGPIVMSILFSAPSFDPSASQAPSHGPKVTRSVAQKAA